MIPGSTTKLTESVVASAATINPKTDVIHVTGSVQINNIIPNFGGGYSGLLILNPVHGVTLGTTGNIAVGIAAVVNRPLWMFYSKAAKKWHINSGV